MKRVFPIILQLGIAVGLLTVTGCKTDIGLGEDPYAGGKAPLGVTFENLNRPLPSARPNDVVLLSVRGLKDKEARLEVFVNEEVTQVVAVSDSTLEIRLPQQVSSGAVKVKIDEQIFFGPKVTVEGKASFDADYGIKNGFTGSVMEILNVSGNTWVVGNFTDFEYEAAPKVFRNGIHIISSTGNSVTDTTINKIRWGAVGGLSSITRLPDGRFVVGGTMVSYDKRQVFGLTRLLYRGDLDTVKVELINTTPEKPQNALDTLPAFNANLYGPVVKVFATPDTGVIAVGNFSMHSFMNYEYSSRETRTYTFTRVNNLVKIRANGRVDSSFSYQNLGSNGFINDAIQLNDGRIVVIGSFTTFNGTSANRIVAFNTDGSISTAFAANIGQGANDEIVSMTYNKTLNKIALAGRFTSFNGQADKYGVVILNGDGSVDNFKLGDVHGKIPNFAYIMNNGKVLVTGDFVKYNGVHRSQLLILEADGNALQEYNNIGAFAGWINTVVETTSSMGYPALLIGGSISMADGRKVGNIFKLEIRN